MILPMIPEIAIMQRIIVQIFIPKGISPSPPPVDNLLYMKNGHTTYSWNIMCQKWECDCGLWVLNEIIFKKYAESLKKIVGAVWELPAK